MSELGTEFGNSWLPDLSPDHYVTHLPVAHPVYHLNSSVDFRCVHRNKNLSAFGGALSVLPAAGGAGSLLAAVGTGCPALEEFCATALLIAGACALACPLLRMPLDFQRASPNVTPKCMT